LGLYFGDFDNNGSIDPVFTYHADGNVYPYASRYEMLQQVKGLESRFPSHESYAEATISDVFPEASLKRAGYYEVNILSSIYLENRNNDLVTTDLPVQAQFAPIYAIESGDFNKDGNTDIILAGNQSANRVRLGPVDANFGQLFLGDGKGSFTYMPQSQSGFHSRGDVRSLSRINWHERDMIIFGVNNSSLEFYRLTGLDK
jgi:hypothetical protein